MPSRPEILVVEDDSSVRELLQRVIAGAGFGVSAVADGIEGLDIVNRKPFDAIISDVRMDGMDGIEFLKRVKSIRPETPVVLMTGFPTMDMAVDAMHEGAFDFIYKPFRTQGLLQVLERALKSHGESTLGRKGATAPADEHASRAITRKLKELSVLLSFSEEMRQTRGLSDAGWKAVELLARVFECREAALFVVSGGIAPKLAAGSGFALEDSVRRSELTDLARVAAGMSDAVGLVQDRSTPDRKRGAFAGKGPLRALAARLAGETAGFGVVVLAGKRGQGEFTEADAELLEVFADHLGTLLEKERLFEAIEEENLRNKAELEMAQRVQQRLLPSRMPIRKGIRLAAHSSPARKVGGDFHGFVESYESTLRFFIGDVSGKGVASALIMAMATNIIRDQGKRYRAPEKILEEANTSLRECLGPSSSLYVTAFFGILDLKKMDLRYAKAGHEKPFLLRAATGGLDPLDAEGSVLGMFESAGCEVRRVKLEAGDRLFLFTDGVIDAVNAAGERFGLERLEKLLVEGASLDPLSAKRELCCRLDEWTEGVEQQDDVTFLIIEAGYAGWEDRVVAGVSERADRLKAEIYEYLRTLEPPPMVFEDLRFCIRETISNAIEHGNKNDPSKQVRVSWIADDREFRIRVADQGEGFDRSALPDPTHPENATNPRGRGIYMLRTLMDRVEWNDRGNEITLVKCIVPDPA